jgi:hypothetical protein
MRLLEENHKRISAAWEFLASLEEHERFFAKILYDKETPACLNRRNFHSTLLLLLDLKHRQWQTIREL